MILTLDVICKVCGSENKISVMMDPRDHLSCRDSRCSCGNYIAEQERERLYHLVDTFQTFNERSRYGKIIRFAIFPYD